jgi:hypothetical protein
VPGLGAGVRQPSRTASSWITGHDRRTTTYLARHAANRTEPIVGQRMEDGPRHRPARDAEVTRAWLAGHEHAGPFGQKNPCATYQYRVVIPRLVPMAGAHAWRRLRMRAVT